MSDRVPSGGTLPIACPFLALEEDRDLRSAVPDGRHRCYAELAPQPRALTYQETFCLTPAFASCRSFLDWAARAAAEPVPDQVSPDGAAARPFAPIPEPPVAEIPPPREAHHRGVGAVPTVLPPPPPGYAPPPAWQPPGQVSAPAWQPGDTADAAGFVWAAPPPWVAQPAMRSTATLPDSARPPLDAERLGWTVSGQAAPPPADEGTSEFPEWPPLPRSGRVAGTFGASRSAPFSPPFSPTGTPDMPETPDTPDGGAVPGVETQASGPAHPPAPLSAPAPAPPGSGWSAGVGPPPTPIAIRIGDGPVPMHASQAPASGASAWQGVLGEPSTGSRSGQPGEFPADQVIGDSTPAGAGPESIASTPMPAAGAPAADLASRSRWLPSFLSRGPHDETGTTGTTGAIASRTGPGPAISATTTAEGAPPGAEGDDAHPAADALPSAVKAVEVGTAAPSPVEDDPPGALAPRRRQPPGVPLDASAPVATTPQARRRARAHGSGEWNQPEGDGPRRGWRRLRPGAIPPVALAAVALFLAAAILFLAPGLLTHDPAPTAPPTAALDPGGFVGSPRPDRSTAPFATQAATGEFDTYTVRGGDTLIDIARRFTITKEVLICANRQLRRNPDLLSIGQVLQIPPEDWQCPTPPKPTKKPQGG